MIFQELETLIQERKKTTNASSYTCRLLTQKNLVERKVHEELYEVLEAAFTGNKDQLVYEIGDLIYHLLVLLGKYEITLDEVDRELKKRRKKE